MVRVAPPGPSVAPLTLADPQQCPSHAEHVSYFTLNKARPLNSPPNPLNASPSALSPTRASAPPLRSPPSHAQTHAPKVNFPKLRRTFCKGKKCRKHTQHKVTQYKAGKSSNYAQGT